MSYSCDTISRNCLDGVDYCNTLVDGLDNYDDKTLYYVAIVVPSVICGCTLIFCLCACCIIYYGVQAIMSWRSKQKRSVKKNFKQTVPA